MSEARTDIAFAARGITKSFGPVRALRGVELELRRGEVTALMGENGAGKSTLLKIITGDYQPDGGVLELDGAPVVFAGPGVSRASGVRVIAQEPEIVPHVSVAENIFIGSSATSGPSCSNAPRPPSTSGVSAGSSGPSSSAAPSRPHSGRSSRSCGRSSPSPR
jgi:ABC-type sugar transport system ATPase subunit